MKAVVMKFGGTSVTGAERITRMAESVRDFRAGRLPHAAREAERRLVVVVPAFSGVTDALVRAGALRPSATVKP